MATLSPKHGLQGLLDMEGPVIVAFVIAFCAIAIVNALEVHVLIWSTFRKYRGLYFWSLFAAVWGVTILTAGVLTDHIGMPSPVTTAYLAILFQPAWWAMVTGQSLVLYSRLHVVLDERRRRWVLYMILFDGVVFHSMTTICALTGSLLGSPGWTMAANDMEKVNVVVFFVQETIIGILYIWQSRRILLSSPEAQEENHFRRVLRRFVWINAFIIVMDASVIGTSFATTMPVEQSLKCAVYAYKLRLEFMILNQLAGLVKPGCRSLNLSNVRNLRQKSGLEDVVYYPSSELQRVLRASNKSDQVQAANEDPAGLVMKEKNAPISRMPSVRKKEKDSSDEEEAILQSPGLAL